ncbi:MAG: HAD-IC family P-type ATPase, partial [Acidobacteria bacterium]|nr:HAD-IC family P-type ATPase [Acidobacteriota bacterium]
MVTGDHALTASSIARQVGLGEAEPRVITGSDIDALSDLELTEIVRKGEPVFARVSPGQKLRIVSALKELGEVVAVTGDGVNDGPALKRADIGIAMGQRGTEVAKEAARIVLADDNFASIVAAVEEGRAVFENIRRFSGYIFNSNPQEVLPFLLWVLVPGFPLLMTVMGVLAVDVGTDLVPAMGLGIEPPEKGIMERPPRRKDQKLLSMRFILRSYLVQGAILCCSCFATWYYFVETVAGGLIPASPPGLDMAQATPLYLQALTAFFFATVAVQIANVLCKRSWQTSLFSRDFLPEERRAALLERLRFWTPKRYAFRIRLDYQVDALGQREAALAFRDLLWNLLLHPLRLTAIALSGIWICLGSFLLAPLLRGLAAFLHAFPLALNLVSNPLILAGIAFELGLSWGFFYTDLAELYYFAPVPWHVYLFAFHGALFLLAFEEAKKYFRRKGYRLEFLG